MSRLRVALPFHLVVGADWSRTACGIMPPHSTWTSRVVSFEVVRAKPEDRCKACEAQAQTR